MNKKHITAAFIMFFLLVSSAYASSKQDQQKELTSDEIVAKMKIQLKLTDDQAVAVKPIIDNYLDREKQLKLEEKKQLSKILTSDQLYTWNYIQNPPPKGKKNLKLF